MKVVERSCPSINIGGAFAGEAAVRLVLLKFTLISGKLFSTSHKEMFINSFGAT